MCNWSTPRNLHRISRELREMSGNDNRQRRVAPAPEVWCNAGFKITSGEVDQVEFLAFKVCQPARLVDTHTRTMQQHIQGPAYVVRRPDGLDGKRVSGGPSSCISDHSTPRAPAARAVLRP